MTPEQLENLKTLVTQVKSDYQQMLIEDVLNRIHLITNRNYARCIQGLKAMLAEKLLTAPWIIGIEKLPALERVIDRAMPIMEAFEAKIVKAGIVTEAPEVTGAIAAKLIAPGDGPKDDEDESQDVVAHAQVQGSFQERNEILQRIMSRINANF